MKQDAAAPAATAEPASGGSKASAWKRGKQLIAEAEPQAGDAALKAKRRSSLANLKQLIMRAQSSNVLNAQQPLLAAFAKVCTVQPQRVAFRVFKPLLFIL
jgi:hypothetical protein